MKEVTLFRMTKLGEDGYIEWAAYGSALSILLAVVNWVFISSNKILNIPEVWFIKENVSSYQTLANYLPPVLIIIGAPFLAYALREEIVLKDMKNNKTSILEFLSFVSKDGTEVSEAIQRSYVDIVIMELSLVTFIGKVYLSQVMILAVLVAYTVNK